MKKIFWGYLLAALSITIQMADGCVLVLPPPFLGVLLMALGCRKLRDSSGRFAAAVFVGFGLSILLAAQWLGNLFGVLGAFPVWGIVSGLLRLVFDWLVIGGICGLEFAYGAALHGAELKVVWVLRLLALVPIWLGSFVSMLAFFALVGLVAAMVLEIVFAVLLYRSWQAYERLQIALAIAEAEVRRNG